MAFQQPLLRSPGVLIYPHLYRRHSRPCNSCDAVVEFRANEFALCGRTDFWNRATTDKRINANRTRQRQPLNVVLRIASRLPVLVVRFVSAWPISRSDAR